MSVIFYILYFFQDEIKQQLSRLLGLAEFPELPIELPLDPFTAIFTVGMIAGSLAFAYSGISDLLRKRKRPPIGVNKTGITTTLMVSFIDDLDPLNAFLSQAKHEIHFLGITLEKARSTRLTIEQKLQDGIKIRFLTLDPDYSSMGEVNKLVVSSGTDNAIRATMSMMCEFKKWYPKQFEMRTHTTPPTMSLIVIDPDRESGIMQVEPYPYGRDKQYRPIITIKQTGQEKVFRAFWSAYESIWKEGKDYPCIP